METTDNLTGSTVDTAAATTAEWPHELATVLTDAAELARAAIAEFSGADTVGGPTCSGDESTLGIGMTLGASSSSHRA